MPTPACPTCCRPIVKGWLPPRAMVVKCACGTALEEHDIYSLLYAWWKSFFLLGFPSIGLVAVLLKFIGVIPFRGDRAFFEEAIFDGVLAGLLGGLAVSAVGMGIGFLVAGAAVAETEAGRHIDRSYVKRYRCDICNFNGRRAATEFGGSIHCPKCNTLLFPEDE